MPPKKRVRLDNSSKEEEKKPQDFAYDPIGSHVLALRTFYRRLVDHRRKLGQRKSPGSIPRMPDYPRNYPTPNFLEKLRKRKYLAKQRLVFKPHISQKKVEEIRTFAIKRILLQIGFDVGNMKDDDNALVHLSHVVDTFLQSFVDRMRYHKNSKDLCNTENAWDTLEITLQEWGFGGVFGIGRYFYGEFVKMHDALYNDCVEEQLQVINEKPPVQRKFRKSLVSQDVPNSNAVTLNNDGNELSQDQ